MSKGQKRKRQAEDDQSEFIGFSSDRFELSLDQASKRARLHSGNNTQVSANYDSSQNVASRPTMGGICSSDIPELEASYDIPGTALSKRAIKRAAIGDNVGSNDKPKGLTRIALDGSMEHFLEKEKKWVPAVIHDKIREELINEYDRQGTYNHGRSEGLKATDVTCFCASQKSWGKDPASWPQVLRQIQPTLKYVKDEVKFWYRDGKIVLDPDDRPIRLLDIPAVCSSKMEDWLMSAIFLSDPKVEILDIRARMPRTIIVAEKGRQVERPLYLPNALSMRMTRFRTKHGLMPREKRGGSQRKEEKLKSFLGEERVKNNDLRDFKPLNTKEIAEVEAVNKGRFGYRSRAENRLGKRKENTSDVDAIPKKKARTSKAELSAIESLGHKRTSPSEVVGEADSPSRQGLDQEINLRVTKNRLLVPGLRHYDAERTYYPYQPEGLQALETRRTPSTAQIHPVETSNEILTETSLLVRAPEDRLDFHGTPIQSRNRRTPSENTYSAFEGIYGIGSQANAGIAAPRNVTSFPLIPDPEWNNHNPLVGTSSVYRDIHGIKGHTNDAIVDSNNVLGFPCTSDEGWIRQNPLTGTPHNSESNNGINGFAENGIVGSRNPLGFHHTQEQDWTEPQSIGRGCGGFEGPDGSLHRADNSVANPSKLHRTMPSIGHGTVEPMSRREELQIGSKNIEKAALSETTYAGVQNAHVEDNFNEKWAPWQDPCTDMFGTYETGIADLNNNEAYSMADESVVVDQAGEQSLSMEELPSTAEWDPEAWTGYL